MTLEPLTIFEVTNSELVNAFVQNDVTVTGIKHL